MMSFPSDAAWDTCSMSGKGGGILRCLGSTHRVSDSNADNTDTGPLDGGCLAKYCLPVVWIAVSNKNGHILDADTVAVRMVEDLRPHQLEPTGSVRTSAAISNLSDCSNHSPFEGVAGQVEIECCLVTYTQQYDRQRQQTCIVRLRCTDKVSSDISQNRPRHSGSYDRHTEHMTVSGKFKNIPMSGISASCTIVEVHSNNSAVVVLLTIV